MRLLTPDCVPETATVLYHSEVEIPVSKVPVVVEIGGNSVAIWWKIGEQWNLSREAETPPC
jgi:hypothetical protein